jgi:hypothetical protein
MYKTKQFYERNVWRRYMFVVSTLIHCMKYGCNWKETTGEKKLNLTNTYLDYLNFVSCRLSAS